MGQIYMMKATLTEEGKKKFNEYEENVLPLIKQYGGRLDRRLRSIDFLTEIHLLWFPSTEQFAAYRNDSRRIQYSHLLVESGASIELLELFEFYE